MDMDLNKSVPAQSLHNEIARALVSHRMCASALSFSFVGKPLITSPSKEICGAFIPLNANFSFSKKLRFVISTTSISKLFSLQNSLVILMISLWSFESTKLDPWECFSCWSISSVLWLDWQNLQILSISKGWSLILKLATKTLILPLKKITNISNNYEIIKAVAYAEWQFADSKSYFTMRAKEFILKCHILLLYFL